MITAEIVLSVRTAMSLEKDVGEEHMKDLQIFRANSYTPGKKL